MGKGLDIQKEGVHIAFSAGTGCLVFLDLVAHLIRKTAGILSPEEDKMLNKDKFKFIFFVTFQSKDLVIGLKLCEGLNKMQKNLKNPFFEFKLILSSSEDYKRWDAESIE